MRNEQYCEFSKALQEPLNQWKYCRYLTPGLGELLCLLARKDRVSLEGDVELWRA